MEKGNGLTPDISHTRPADVLVQNRVGGKPAAFSFTIKSPLINFAGQPSSHSSFAAELAEIRKHQSNNAKCSELGWSCLSLAVETYGNWGKNSVNTFALLAHQIAMDLGYARSMVSHGLKKMQ